MLFECETQEELEHVVKSAQEIITDRNLGVVITESSTLIRLFDVLEDYQDYDDRIPNIITQLKR